MAAPNNSVLRAMTYIPEKKPPVEKEIIEIPCPANMVEPLRQIFRALLSGKTFRIEPEKDPT